MLNFYSFLFSSNSQRVHFLLEHAKIPYTLKTVDLFKGEQLSEAFMKINPFTAVPAIDHDGFLLSESNTILRYLAHKFEKFDLYPQDVGGSAKVDQIIDYTTLHVSRWVQALNWYIHVAPMRKLPVVPELVDDARMQLTRSLPKLNRWLQNSGDFLCGSKLTIADASFLPLVAQIRDPNLKIDISTHNAIKAYSERVLAQPAWVKIAGELRQAMNR